MAIVAPTQSGDGRLNVRTISPAGDVLATSEAFVPSQDFRFMLGFFDQYRLSHPAWLPDGSGLLLAGRRADDAVHGTLGDPVGDYVMLWRAQRGAPLEPLAPGRLGVARPDPLDEAAEG